MKKIFYRLVEPGKQIPEERKSFSNEDLKKLVPPLFF